MNYLAETKFCTIKIYKNRMNTKILTGFLIAVVALFLLATVSAVEITNSAVVKADGVDVATYNGVAIVYPNVMGVVAGESIVIRIEFTANLGTAANESDVKVKAEIEGDKVDVDEISEPFDVENGKRYVKTLSLKIPYELKDETSNDLSLNVKIWSGSFKSEMKDIVLRVQRPSYNADIKSITASKTVEAGESFPVEIVLKNMGYNDLDDLYVTARLSELDIEKTSYFGDLVSLKTNDDEDTAEGTLYLKVPYDVASGVYTLEVEVKNDDTVSSETIEVEVKNDFSETVFVSGNKLWIVNPTNKVVGYRIVPESPASVSESMVFISAGESKTVVVNPNTSGSYDFKVNVFSTDGKLIETVTMNSGAIAEGQIISPVVALTVILAIVFLVLLIVLIVLVTRKPAKSEEFGESYY